MADHRVNALKIAYAYHLAYWPSQMAHRGKLAYLCTTCLCT